MDSYEETAVQQGAQLVLCDDLGSELEGQEGGPRGRGYMLHMASSHCYTAETNAAL